jgi:hypothetical protein
VFHFVPGEPRDASPRVDGRTHPLATTPDSPNARALLAAAFTGPPELSLFRIGIASHAYADTWAHQNFVGMADPFNGMGRSLLPNLGHAGALRRPDRIGLVWRDTRLLAPRVDNNARFLAAARGLFERYREHLGGMGAPAARWDTLSGDLARALGPSGAGRRIGARHERVAAFRRLAPWLPPYRPEAWPAEALLPWEAAAATGRLNPPPGTAPVPPGRRFVPRGPALEETPWGRFQEAARAHLRLGVRLLAPALAEAGKSLETPPMPVEPEAAGALSGLDLESLLAAAPLDVPTDPSEGDGDDPDADLLLPALPLAGPRAPAPAPRRL